MLAGTKALTKPSELMRESRPHVSRRCDNMNRGEEPENQDEGPLTGASGLEKEKSSKDREGEPAQCSLKPYMETDHRAHSPEAKETLYLRQMTGGGGTEWEEQ